ncbi:MAG TPA: ABC transporter permease [Candidatus Merdenecus merdavium]|nr:ABC transporter permease [Candidatus Merdenecus merdavium]
MESLLGFISQGLIYAILAFGIYITYKILDFPDLTVDGSFPLGAAITASLLTKNIHPVVAILVSVIAGVVAGICTGIIHVKLKVRDLLSGIIMMTALYSINLWIAGKSNIPLYNGVTLLFDEPYVINPIFDQLPVAIQPFKQVIILFCITFLLKFLLDAYLQTKSGFLLRAVGDNETLVTSLAKDKGIVKIIGLAIANGLVALSGSIMAQQFGYFDISMGTGTMVIGLASVIMGINLFTGFKKVKPTTAVIVGAVLYQGAWALAIRLGLKTTYMRLVTAMLLLVFLVISMKRNRKVKRDARA